MTDAGHHRLCLLLALIGTVLMGAIAAESLWQTHVTYDMPVFKASKPPILDWSARPKRGPTA